MRGRGEKGLFALTVAFGSLLPGLMGVGMVVGKQIQDRAIQVLKLKVTGACVHESTCKTRANTCSARVHIFKNYLLHRTQPAS
jgi:hypothetical protein